MRIPTRTMMMKSLMKKRNDNDLPAWITVVENIVIIYLTWRILQYSVEGSQRSESQSKQNEQIIDLLKEKKQCIEVI